MTKPVISETEYAQLLDQARADLAHFRRMMVVLRVEHGDVNAGFEMSRFLDSAASGRERSLILAALMEEVTAP